MRGGNWLLPSLKHGESVQERSNGVADTLKPLPRIVPQGPAAPLEPKSREGGLPDFFSIPLATLRIDVVTDFDLYLDVPDRAPVLYRQSRMPFTDEVCRRLKSVRVDHLLVLKEQRDAYNLYVESYLGEILKDERVPLDDRSGMLYESSKQVMRQAMSDPRAGNLLVRASQLVENSTSFLRNQRTALRSLMRLTSHDYYTYTHSVNVFMFSLALAQRLGRDEQSVREFGLGALLHDIGKSRIDLSIVNCRGKLDDAQWQEMRKHPEFGHAILVEMGVSSEVVLDVTRHHHEKLPGNGYPDGLEGEQISQWSRILTICDIFDALTTRRSYKDALTSFPGLKLMRDEMAEEIDMDVFRVFVAMLGEQK